MSEQSVKRPASVIVACVILLILGAWTLLGVAVLSEGNPNTGRSVSPLILIDGVVRAAIFLISGGYMLARQNWARQLFLVATPLEIGLGAMIGIGSQVAAGTAGQVNSNAVLLLLFANLVPYAVLAVLVTSASAAQFFGGSVFRPSSAATGSVEAEDPGSASGEHAAQQGAAADEPQRVSNEP